MNGIVKAIIHFIGGAAIGGGASFFVTKAVVTKKLNAAKEAELAAQREYYENLNKELIDTNKHINDLVYTSDDIDSDDDTEDVPQ